MFLKLRNYGEGFRGGRQQGFRGEGENPLNAILASLQNIAVMTCDPFPDQTLLGKGALKAWIMKVEHTVHTLPVLLIVMVSQI